MAWVADYLDVNITQALEGFGSLGRMASYTTWNPPLYTTCTRSAGPSGNWVNLLSCNQSCVSFADSSWSGDFANWALVWKNSSNAICIKSEHESGGSGTTVKFALGLSPYTVTAHECDAHRDKNNFAALAGTDIRVCRLTTTVGVATPAYVMPSNWREYLPNLNHRTNCSGSFNSGGIPIACYDQDNNVIAAWLNGYDTPTLCAADPQDADLLVMYQGAVLNDSSGPMMIPWQPNAAMILLGPTYTVPWVCYCVSDLMDEINAAMDDLVPGASLNVVNWSAFQTSVPPTGIVSRRRNVIVPRVGSRSAA